MRIHPRHLRRGKYTIAFLSGCLFLWRHSIVAQVVTPDPTGPTGAQNATNRHSAELGIAEPKAPTIGIEQAKKIALLFLAGHNVNLTYRGLEPHVAAREGRGQSCYHFEGPPEQGLSIDVDAQSGLVCDFRWGELERQSRRVALTLAQARQRATAFLTTKAKVPLGPNNYVMHEELLQRGDAGKVYDFMWGKIVDGVEQPFILSVFVSATTGDIAEYLLVDHQVIVSPLNPPVTREQAIKLVTPLVDLKPNWRMQYARLVITSPNQKPNVRWRVRVQGMKQGDYAPEAGQMEYEVVKDYYLDAATGKVINIFGYPGDPKRTLRLRPSIPRPQLVYQDIYPVWSPRKPGELLCVTSRPLNAVPAADSTVLYYPRMKYATRLALVEPDGTMQALLQLPLIPHTPAWSPDGARIAFMLWDMVYILDMRTGTLGRCNDYEIVERSMPSWDPTGKLLAMSGNDTEVHSDTDIFAAQIADRLSAVSMTRNWRVARLSGTDMLPTFSPDGKWIVFAHEEARPKASSAKVDTSDGNPDASNHWSLYRVSAAKHDLEKEVPELIVSGLPEPERINWFPDGNRLLVSYGCTRMPQHRLLQKLSIS